MEYNLTRYIASEVEVRAMKHQITVHGMHCKSCVAIVKMALEDKGAKEILIDLDEIKQTGKVRTEFSGTREELIVAINNEGYKAR